MKKFIGSVLCLFIMMGCGSPELPEGYGKTDVRLYLGDGNDQPLVIGLGGSEGGNAWDSDRWKSTRDLFVKEGYAFAALEYFGGPTTPANLDRISLNAVHDAILEIARNPKINARQIAVIGGSKGAELALLLASHFEDIKCVVAIVPSHVAFPALTMSASTSSWLMDGEEVPYVPMPWAAVPAATTGDLRKAFSIMLEDRDAVAKALIEVEKINGTILLLSATEDEMWPSAEMSAAMMERLKKHNFPHAYEHILIEGSHTEPLKHFDRILGFMRKEFPVGL